MNCLFEYLKSCPWQPDVSYKLLKIRHNLFAESYMSDNSINVVATDYPLRKIGIDSDLTPDIYLGEKRFIEFFVSSNPDYALENKVSKYGRIEGLDMTYIYLDTRDMTVYQSTSQEEIPLGESMKRYIGFLTSKMRYMKYVRLDSSDLICSNITPGYMFDMQDRIVTFEADYRQFTNEEYLNSLRDIKEKLGELNDEEYYDVSFDCETRKFNIIKGKNKWETIERNISNINYVRSIIIYKNYKVVEVNMSKNVSDKISSGYYNLSECHKFNMRVSDFSEKCIEVPMRANEIFSELDKLSFQGLFSNKLSSNTIKEEAVFFYDYWREMSSSVLNPKIKMITMLPIFDVEKINQDLTRRIPFQNELNRYLTDSILNKYPRTIRQGITAEEEKEFVENKKKIDSYTTIMKGQRKGWIQLEGSSQVSYKINLMNDIIKDMIRQGIKKSDDALNKFCIEHNPEGEIDKEYFRNMFEKEIIKRNNRKISKKRIYKSNTVTMEKRMQSVSENEKMMVSNNGKDRGEEVMGMFGYNGIMLFDELQSLIRSSWDYLCGTCESNDYFNMDVSGYAFPNNRVGEDTKNMYLTFRGLFDQLRRTRIFWVICLLSNFCRSIWAISTYKTKRRTVVFDRCGTRSCAIFCNGTGNIQKFKSSKSFKIMGPVNSIMKKLCGMSSSRNNDIGFVDGTEYFITHWMYLKIQHLKFYMELPMRWIQIMVCIMTEYSISSIREEVCMIITMNMLNGRRKTENLLHDMKYLTYNMFGVRGCYRDLLLDKFILPRDMWMRYLEEKFLRGIPDYIDSLERNNLLNVDQNSSYPSYRIIHPLCDREYDMDTFNLVVYSSYVFPKGVFTQYTEQLVNMGSILDIHNKAMVLLGDSQCYKDVKSRSDVPIEKIFENDLFYNSGVVSAVGAFAEKELLTSDKNYEIRSSWYKIINSDITEYANSHGLRRDNLSDGASWGKKGHDIMTKYISEHTNPEEIQMLKGVRLSDNLIDAKKNKFLISSSKYSIIRFSKENPVKKIQLNNANKVQWGGSREIYIMTHSAKNIQWSLEQMFKSISHMIDNEIIHVPASSRMSLLYNSVKRNTVGIRYYLTLDCRKWAPLSNLNKYVIFINSMSGILPKEFLEDFNYFFKLYYNKQLFFREKDVEDFIKQPRNQCYKGYFFHSGSAYYIRMPYSFMMGMFNYLSSIFHAMSQRYFIKNILPFIESKWGCSIYMNMFAHSDDSGGFLEIYNTYNHDKILDDVLRMYESFQKCCNHMLSLKKCVVSNSYFEITSYCFIKTDPMPVLPKFIYNHQINLTPSGFISDVKSLSSDVTEIVMNGGSFQCAFFKYLCLGMSYRKFCLNKGITDVSSRISLDLLGFPLIHPYYIMTYKNNYENKWFSDISDECYSKNLEMKESLGIIGPWGENCGLQVRLVSFKSRAEDGRFLNYENDDKIPDEIIPSGHYISYMMKMANKFYRDTMWYSLHDIDGTILQSNMFNNGMSQTYKVYGVELGIVSFSDAVEVKLTAPKGEGDKEYNKFQPDNYVSELSAYLDYNAKVEFSPSQVRPKPCQLNTYYSKWWKSNKGDAKSAMLGMICPWMCYIMSDPRDIPMILSGIETHNKQDIMKRIMEEDPLLSLDVLTRSPARLMDRYDLIGSWYFSNSYPMQSPKKMRRRPAYYFTQDKSIHPECIAAMMFEVSTNPDQKVNLDDFTIKQKIGNSDIETAITCTSWLRNFAISDSPIVNIILTKDPYKWLAEVDYISFRNNQYSVKGKYWVGNTTLYARVSGRYYRLTVRSGKITEIYCGRQYTIKQIRSDLDTISPYGFSYDLLVSDNKFRNVNRITCDLLGTWDWTERATGTTYYSNIYFDPDAYEYGKLKYSKKDLSCISDMEVGSMLPYLKKSLMLQSGGQMHKAYLIHRKPCNDCMSKMYYKGREVKGTDPEYECSYSKEEIIENLRSTHLYNDIYNFLEEYGSIIPEESRYMCSPGSLLSCIYKGNFDSNAVTYMVDYRSELTLNSMSENIVPQERVNMIRTKLSSFLKMNLVGSEVTITADEMKMNEIINQEGFDNVCTALALMPMERTLKYYTPLTFQQHWYNNTEVLPQFIKDTLSYINSTVGKQNGRMADKKRLIDMICNEIQHWVSVSYKDQIQRNFRWRYMISMRLYYMLKEFRDLGQCDDPEVSENYYYDPLSIVGSMKGFITYLLNFTMRRQGKLIDGYKLGYKRMFNSFSKKYRTYCNDKFGITVKQYNPAVMKVAKIEYFQKRIVDEEDENSEVVVCYPLQDCDQMDFNDEPEEFDEDVMTYDIEDSMLDWEFDPEENYDAANQSIFREEGYVTSCGIVDQEEMINWVLDDNRDFRMRVSYNNGIKPIAVFNGEFKLTNAASMNYDYGKIVSELIDKGTTETRLIDHLIDQLNGRMVSKGVSKDMIKLDEQSKSYRAKNMTIFGVLEKTAILKQIGAKGFDITRMIEGEQNYERITNDTETLKFHNLNPYSVAEVNKINPDILPMMANGTFRITRTAYEEMKKSQYTFRFKNRECLLLYQTLLRSLIITDSPDIITERVFRIMVSMRDDLAELSGRYSDEQYPKPGIINPNEIHLKFI